MMYLYLAVNALTTYDWLPLFFDEHFFFQSVLWPTMSQMIFALLEQRIVDVIG